MRRCKEVFFIFFGSLEFIFLEDINEGKIRVKLEIFRSEGCIFNGFYFR